MRAIRYYGPGDLRLEDVPEPVPGPGQIKVKIAWNGICGSDLHCWFDYLPGVTPSATEPHPLTGEILPVTLGHEFSGTIVELGPDVDLSRFAVGQGVVVEPMLTCMLPSCKECASASTRNLCTKIAYMGISGCGGGLSEYVAANQHIVYPLPQGTSLEVGAMVEPLAVAWRAVKRSNVKSGDSVLILGAGPIALLILAVLKAKGIDTSWTGLTGRSSKRCELGRHFGATVLDTRDSQLDVAATTLEASSCGVNVIFDCVGDQASFDLSLAVARRGGTIMNIALWKEKPAVDMSTLMLKEVNIISSIAYAGDHPELLEAMGQGRFAGSNLEDLVTRKIALEDLVEKGIKGLIHEKQDMVKILVHP